MNQTLVVAVSGKSTTNIWMQESRISIAKKYEKSEYQLQINAAKSHSQLATGVVNV